MTLNARPFAAVTILSLLVFAGLPMKGCDSLPGDRETQGAVIGGAGGAVLGAVIASENRLLGALIGGALGAAGGYIIGANTDWFGKDDDEVREEATESAEDARDNPATPEEALRAKTADINKDGFVTLDEVVAMESAGMEDDEIIRRLEATGQVFDLNASQEKVLRDNSVSDRVIRRMQEINRAERDRLMGITSTNDGSRDVISRDPETDRDD